MIQELLARAAEDLTVALNNFETARKELTDDELAAFKEVCRKAKEAVREALEAAKGDLEAKTAETIRQIETLLAQSTQAIEQKITEAKKDVDAKVQQGLTSIDEKVAQAGADITGKVDKAKQDVDTKVQQGLTSIDEKVAQAGTDITGKVDKAKQDVDTKVQQGLTSIDEKVAQAGADIYTKIQQGDTNTLKSAKSYTDSLLIKIFQNGYIQWPSMPSPDTLFNFKGYRWAEVNYDGCFFRAKGKGANPFDGDEQGDAIRNITGELDTAISSRGYFITRDIQEGIDFSPVVRGALSFKGSYNQSYKLSSEYIRNLQDKNRYGSYINFNAANQVPTAEENRPRNKTVIIWKLEKI